METVPQNKMIELANYLQKRRDYKDVKLGYGETLPGDYITGKVHRFQRSRRGDWMPFKITIRKRSKGYLIHVRKGFRNDAQGYSFVVPQFYKAVIAIQIKEYVNRNLKSLEEKSKLRKS